MREFKFRAWQQFDREFRSLDHQSNYYIGFYFGHDGTELKDDFIISQYTETKDKNDNEIWEGDILKIYRDGEIIIATIIFFNGCFGWNDHTYHNEFYSMSTTMEVIAEDNINYSIEVIGNIYQNSDLLG